MTALAIRDDVQVEASDFVAQLNAEYDAWHDSYRDQLKHAIRVGLMLHGVKDAKDMKHGAWKGWLGENFKGSYSAAQRAMQIAGVYTSDPKALQNADGQMPNSITGALNAIKRNKATSSEKVLRLIPGGQAEAPVVDAEVVYSLTLKQLVAFASKRWHRTPPTEEAVLAWLTENEIAA